MTQALLDPAHEELVETSASPPAGRNALLLETNPFAETLDPGDFDDEATFHRRRARRILDREIEYIRSPSFEAPDAAERILGPPDGGEDGTGEFEARRPTAEPPPGTPPYLAELYSIPLLTAEEESDLFRRMNFLKYRADVLRQDLDPDRPRPDRLDHIETLLSDALRVRNRIVQANLRLVVSVAKKMVDHANSLDELISDGNLPLIRAVEIFDFERGTRFSTYATWAIRNSLYRSTPRNRRRLTRYRTGTKAAFEILSDHRFRPRGRESYHRGLRAAIDRMLSELDSRDRAIVLSRFGLDDDRPRRFREIAEQFNLSTERVRQLLNRSLDRLQDLAETEAVELDA